MGYAYLHRQGVEVMYAVIKNFMNGDLGTGYKSIEELASWRDRLLAEAA